MRLKLCLAALPLLVASCKHDALVEVKPVLPADPKVILPSVIPFPKTDTFEGSFQQSETYLSRWWDTSIQTRAYITHTSDSDFFIRMRIHTVFPERYTTGTISPRLALPTYIDLAEQVRGSRSSGIYYIKSGGFSNTTIGFNAHGDSLFLLDHVGKIEDFTISNSFVGKRR